MPDLKDFSADVQAAIQRGFQTGMKRTEALAVAKSSGPFSLAQLAQMDHPYAKRHGSPSLDPSTINVQTGAFRRAWRARITFSGSTVMRFEITNDDPVAEFLIHGTKTMFARPIDREVEAQGQPITEDAITREIENVFNQLYS